MSKIFRSRWLALLWAGGVIWTAYDVAEAAAPSKQPTAVSAKATAQPTDASAVGISEDDLATLSAFVNGN